MELRIPLPEPWAWFDAEDSTNDAEMIAGMAQLSPEAATTATAYFAWLRRLLGSSDIAAMGALAIPDEDPSLMALAWCLTSYGQVPATPENLTHIAVTAGDWTEEPTPEWLTGAPQATLRATAFRLAADLALPNGEQPIMWRARYAVALAPELAAVVEFETPTIAYVDEFREMFDIIMQSATVN